MQLEKINSRLQPFHTTWEGRVDIYEGLNPLEVLYKTLERCNENFEPHKIKGNHPWYRVNDPCAYCGGESETWDHIEPLIRSNKNKNRHARNESQNLTRACFDCNQKKGSLTLLEFLLSKQRPDMLVRRKRLHQLGWLLWNLTRKKAALAKTPSSL